jgi:hypothetical protein
MMRFYFDTSGAVTDREDPRRVETTRKVLRAVEEGLHDGAISNVVQEALEQAPMEVRPIILRELNRIEFELVTKDLESRGLFEEYEAARILPKRYRNDLRHLAVATVARVDALVSWNFRHLVNLRTRRAVHAVNVRTGYPLIEIVSPEEV